MLLFMSSFNVARHLFKIAKILREENVPNTYKLETPQLVLLGLSIGYILTVILTGIEL
jgi:hypothetical protein